MNIVKIPRKLRDIFAILRNGQIEAGLEQLEKIKGFGPQKAIVKAETGYFSNDYENAMANDENGLPFDEQWYAGNILFEHFFAYSNAAIISKNISRAENFYRNFLAEKEKSDLPEHRINVYRHQVKNHLAKLYGEKDLIIDNNLPPIVTNGKSTGEFIAQLKEYRPGLAFNSIEGAEYILNFMLEQGNTDESLAYYEKFADKIVNNNTHIHATRLYLLAKESGKAKKSLMRFVNNWYPVEHIQITPMILFSYEDLYPILTKEFKQEILNMPKAKQ
ncbi:MAG: hypothetical protein KF862_05585 [Chitinophagaceae bacterium]|nr:hypothetical protein [Chitinophagaceae bacterium]